MIPISSASGFLALDFNVNRDGVKAVIAVDPVSMRELNLSKISSPVLKIWEAGIKFLILRILDCKKIEVRKGRNYQRGRARMIF